MAKLNPMPPGELLREEFLGPMGLSQSRLAREIGLPAQRIGEIVAGKRAITADTDLRLCRFQQPSVPRPPNAWHLGGQVRWSAPTAASGRRAAVGVPGERHGRRRHRQGGARASPARAKIRAS
jgi:addiction module HigA family antidote